MTGVQARKRARRKGLVDSFAIALTLFIATSLTRAIGPTEDETRGSLVVQLLWGSIYMYAAVRLYQLRPRAISVLQGSKLLTAFVLLQLLSTLWSTNSGATFKNAVELIGSTAFAWFIVTRFTLSRFLSVLSATFVAAASLSLLLVVFSPGRGRADWGSGPWVGIYDGKNGLGVAMAFSLLTLFLKFLASRGRARTYVGAAILLCASLLVGSNSITAAIALLTTLIIVVTILLCTSRRYGVLALAATSAGVALAALATMLFGLNFSSVFEFFGRGDSLTGRTDFWPSLTAAIGDRPILGYGYNAFFLPSGPADTYLSYFRIEAGGWFPSHAHNSLLQVMLETGIVGAVLLALLIAQSIFRTVSYFARERTAIAAWPLAIVVFLTVSSYTETEFARYNEIQWLIFVAAILYCVPAPKLVPGRTRSPLSLATTGTKEVPAFRRDVDDAPNVAPRR